MIQVGPRLIEARLVGARIDSEKQIAGAYELIVPDRQGDDRPGNPRRNLNDTCLDLPIAGPGVGDMGPGLEEDDHDRQHTIAPVSSILRMDFMDGGQKGMKRAPITTV